MTEAKVEERLTLLMRPAWDDVTRHARNHDMSLPDATTFLAVQRVADAHILRGLYP